jgi:N-sulfoglucosamine sulfohydrolase
MNTQKPNVLLILADDLGVQTGCYGNPTARTPNIDALAAEGVLFERAYATSSICSPSRASMFTGLFPHQHGLLGMPWGYRVLAGAPRLPERLREVGYRTGLIGKKHVDAEEPLGFDVEESVAEPRKVRSFVEPVRRFLSEAEGNPFFLTVGFVDPHTPHVNRQIDGFPEHLLGPEDITPLPFQGVWDTPELRAGVAGYENNVARFDAGVGVVLDVLEKAGLAKSTVVILHSDHGPGFYRAKASSYEPGVHVPLIVRWPGCSEAGLRRSELVSNVDLLPTILSLCGARLPEDLPGTSFDGLLQPGACEWRDSMFCEYHGNQTADFYPMRTVRNDRYKLILNLLSERANPVVPYLRIPYGNLLPFEEKSMLGTQTMTAFKVFAHPPREELYDLEADPVEFVNLASEKEHAPVLDRLRQDLQEWREKTCDPYLDPAYLERMTAYYDSGAAEQEKRGERYSYKEGILFDVDMQVLYPEGILQVWG